MSKTGSGITRRGFAAGALGSGLILGSGRQKGYQGGNTTESGNGLVILGVGGEVANYHGAVLLPKFVRSLMAQVRHDMLKRIDLIGNLHPVQSRHRRIGKGKDRKSLDLLIPRLE